MIRSRCGACSRDGTPCGWMLVLGSVAAQVVSYGIGRRHGYEDGVETGGKVR